MGIELKRIKICKCTSEVDAEFNTLAGLHMSLVVVFFRVRLFLCLKDINFFYFKLISFVCFHHFNILILKIIFLKIYILF
jgi:hypothetical protein